MFQQLLHNPIPDLQQKLHTACGVRGCYDVERTLVTIDTKGFYEI